MTVAPPEPNAPLRAALMAAKAERAERMPA